MKVLKTYGRKFKTSVLEVSNTKRDWSPEVVVLQTPPRNRSDILFESLCNPSAQVKRAPRGKVKYGNVTNLFNDSSVQPDKGRQKKSGSGLSENRGCRKRPRKNANTLRKPLAAQQNDVAQSLAGKRAGPRQRKVARPPTKLSLRSKKPQAQPLPSTSTGNGDFSRNESAMRSPSSACSTSSCEIPRRLLKGDSSFSLSLDSPVNPTSSTPKKNVKCNTVDAVSIGLSLLSDMSNTDLSSHRSRRGGSSVEGSSNWVTFRKKRNGANWRCVDKENKKKARLSFESEDASNSPVRDKWSPFMVSTPMPNAQVNKVGTEGWILNSAIETPHVAPATSSRHSVLAQGSATLKKQDQQTGTHKANHGLRRNLSSAMSFQDASLGNLSGLSREIFPENTVTTTSKVVDYSGHMSTLTNSILSKPACSIAPLQCNESSAELFVSQQTDVEVSNISVDIEGLQGGELSKADATFGEHSARLDTSALQECVHMSETEKSKGHVEPEASHQLLEKYSELFTKELHVKVADIMKKLNADKEQSQHSSLVIAQSYSEKTFSLEKGTQQNAFKLKELRVVLTDLKHEEAKNKNVLGYSTDMSSLVDKDDAKQSVSLQKATMGKGFAMNEVNILKNARHKIQKKSEAHPTKGKTPDISSSGEPQLTTRSDGIDQLCSLKDKALWEKFQLKDVCVVLTDLKDQSATMQHKNGAHVNYTLPHKKPLMQESVCAPFSRADVCHQNPSSSCEQQGSHSWNVSTVHQSSNTPFQHCPGESSKFEMSNVPDIKLGQVINSFSCQMEQKLPQTSNRKIIKKNSQGHEKSIDTEPLLMPSVTYGTKNSLSSTSEGFETQIMPSPHSSSKYKNKVLEQCSSNETKLKEAKVVLKRSNAQCQPMKPPPPPSPPALKEKSDKSRNRSNNGPLNCVEDRRITASNCNSLQNQSKKENWAACMRRQARLTMARRSAIPPRMPLDANRMLLDICNQHKPVTFKQALGVGAFKECVKIGEGLYGEVFRIGRGSEASAIKIVPIEGSFLVNGEKQKTAAQILPEAIICQELSALSKTEQATSCPNFIEVKRLHYVQGKYPSALLKQWDVFDSERTSENDRPDCFKTGQKYFMFQFSDGGISLEDYEINSATEAKSIFLQVACALAVAETALEFEHRDLHWGNILVAPAEKRYIHCRLPQGRFILDTNGVFVSVIDYTLSRLRKGGAVIFTDVSHEDELFSGVGDYQFDIYRRMKEHNQNDWKSFKPYTNALWLHYLSCKLLEKGWSSTRSRQQSSAVAELREWSDKLILQCSSSIDIFLRCIGTQSTQNTTGAYYR